MGYNSSNGMVTASAKLLNTLRKAEAREIVGQLLDFEEQERNKAKDTKGLKRRAEEIANMMSSEARMERSQNEMDIMSGKRPRYASTKMEPDECEDFGGMKGGVKGGAGGMTGVIGF